MKNQANEELPTTVIMELEGVAFRLLKIFDELEAIKKQVWEEMSILKNIKDGKIMSNNLPSSAVDEEE